MSGQKKRRTAGSVIASVFLSILLLVPLTAGIFWWELRDIFSEKGIEYCLDRIDPEKIRLSDIGAGGTGTLLDKLAGSVNEMFGYEAVTAPVLKEKLEASTLKPFLAREAGDIFEDLKHGTSLAALTPEEISAFVEENWSLFADLIPAVSEEVLAEAADMAVAGDAADSGFAEVVRDYLKKHDPPEKYDGMIRTFQETGKIEEEDRELLTEFMKDYLIPGMYQDQISEKLTAKEIKTLNTAYLRSQMGPEAENIIGTAFSLLPGLALLGIIFILVLLYFAADRHIPGDAFIGIGALMITVCGALAALGSFDPAQSTLRQLAEENYFAYCLTKAFLGFHQTRNLIIAGTGLGLVALGIILNGRSRRRSRQSDQPDQL